MSGLIGKLLGYSSSGDAALKLEKLRSDPERAGAEYSFVVTGTADYGNRTEGGRCTIECSELGNGIYELQAVGSSGRDYFFPFVSIGTQGGVGRCRVPLGCPNGTIVITGAMNGCSLEVRREPAGLAFMHDANGMAMSAMSATDPRRAGEMVCRLDAKDYMNERFQVNRAASMSTGAPANTTVMAAPQNFLISIRSDGKWKVVRSAMMLVGKKIDGQQPTQSYERMPTITNLLTVFKE